MQPFDQAELAALFQRTSPQYRHLPDVSVVDWGVLEYLGWLHPSGHLGYVALRLQGEAIGLVLRRASFPSQPRRTHMCAWCHTLHRTSGIAAFSRWVDGSDGRRSIGVNLCRSLDCSLRLRNLTGDDRLVMPETLDVPLKAMRLEQAVARYVRRVRPREHGRA